MHTRYFSTLISLLLQGFDRLITTNIQLSLAYITLDVSSLKCSGRMNNWAPSKVWGHSVHKQSPKQISTTSSLSLRGKNSTCILQLILQCVLQKYRSTVHCTLHDVLYTGRTVHRAYCTLAVGRSAGEPVHRAHCCGSCVCAEGGGGLLLRMRHLSRKGATAVNSI